jgi:hypothetical protein
MQRVLSAGVRQLSSSDEIDQLRAEADYYRDRVALMRAKLYRLGLGSNARLQELERQLERAQNRLRYARRQPKP